MSFGPQLLLIGAVAAVGVLHTIVPDHWVPITLIARQRGWTSAETLRAALQAGTGHVVSTLVIALIVWWAGVAVAQRFGHLVDTASSLALIAFGAWIALSAWRDLRGDQRGHGHSHRHDHPHGHSSEPDDGSIHGTELQRIATPDGPLELSIFESGVAPRFRLSGTGADADADVVTVQTHRENGQRQDFRLINRGGYWESAEEIPEPHQFGVSITLEHRGHVHRHETRFLEHAHQHKNTGRTALLLILGSSPMVEGIPAFFAAARYGVAVVAVMAVVFAISTIATYAVLCVYSTARLRRVRLGAFERYGEVMSGAFIAVVGVAFWVWPVL